MDNATASEPYNRAATQSAPWTAGLIKSQAREIERLQAEVNRLREMLGLEVRRTI